MSIVIPFAPRPRPAGTTGAENPPRPAAQILFFTGVRYERQPEPVLAEPQIRRRRRAVLAAPRPKRARQPA